MAVKTITMTGVEVAVTGLDGTHAHIRNDGTDTIYAAKTARITAGADGVASIPAGQADTIRGISGTVYLLGTGSVLVQSDDYVASPFKTAAQASGSGADEVARAAISTHAGNADIHVTTEEKAAWSAINYSNPNLLINPDFKVNQRGQAEYTINGVYTVDRWKLVIGSPTDDASPKVEVTDNGITINAVGCNAYLFSALEYAPLGKTVTYSVSINGNVYSTTVTLPEVAPETDNTIMSIISTPNEGRIADIHLNSNGTLGTNVSAMMGKTNHFEWAKLELGNAATPFVPPDPATELAKCQRYFYRTPAYNAASASTFGVGFIGGISYATVNITLPTTMRINPIMTLNGTLSLATAGYNGNDGVIKVSNTIPGSHSSPNSATMVFDISDTNDESIVGNCCLLQNRDGGYIDISAEL